MLLRKSVLGSLKPNAAAHARTATRGFAENPNDIAKRITSTKSIEKITKSMKMVSAAKLRGDQDRLEQGRPFGASFAQLFNAPITHLDDAETADLGDAQSPIYVPFTSDRGLCGGVNTLVCKAVKLSAENDKAAGKEPKIFIIGEKGTGQIARTHGENIVSSTDLTWKTPINFAKSCAIADRVLAPESDEIRIVYNRFVSAITYETEIMQITNLPVVQAQNTEEVELPAPLNKYEIEPELTEEAIQNLFEFGIAVQTYGCGIENATSEQSARMAAMDGASKNASEMVENLTILYNRARQARITTELIEIISGAESLKG